MAITTASLQAAPSADVPVLAVGRGERIDVHPVVEYLRPFIVAAQATADAERRIPESLIAELERVGVFRAFLPREVGGLELHPSDEMELLYELGRIDAATAWAALGQNGGMMLPAPDVIAELKAAAGGRWIISGSHSRVGRAVVDGDGYRIYGQWHFASGSPWATHLTAFVHVEDEHGDKIIDEETGETLLIDVVLPRDAVTLVNDWDGMGLRGTASGRFTVDGAYVHASHGVRMGIADETYQDRALYRHFYPAIDVAVNLGIAHGILDACMPHVDESSEYSRVQIAEAMAKIRAARSWAIETTEALYDNAFLGETPTTYQLTVDMWLAGIHAGRAAKDAATAAFEAAHTKSVVVGRGIERRYRDLLTVTQHEGYWMRQYSYLGQFIISGGKRLEGHPLLLPPSFYGIDPGA
ncbi:flavin-dependent monooxygenase [Leifsonia kafniensis]|uniref:Flavin-dependent monooxygenase n=1 Tax=Leifsonia kafniensis TaxID=475957 RepID=A0ABP7KML9_9MICO